MFGFGKSDEEKKQEFLKEASEYLNYYNPGSNYFLTEKGKKARAEIERTQEGRDFDVKKAKLLLCQLQSPVSDLYEKLAQNRELRTISFDLRQLYQAMKNEDFDSKIWHVAANDLTGIKISGWRYPDLWHAVHFFKHKFDGVPLPLGKAEEMKFYGEEILAPEAAKQIFNAVIAKKEINNKGEVTTDYGEETKGWIIFDYSPPKLTPLKALIFERHKQLMESNSSQEEDGPEEVYRNLALFSENYLDLSDEELLKCVVYMVMTVELSLRGDDLKGSLIQGGYADESIDFDNIDRQKMQEQIATLNDFVLEFISPASVQNIRDGLEKQQMDGDPFGILSEVIGAGRETLIGVLREAISDIRIKLVKPLDQIEESSETGGQGGDDVTEKLEKIQSLLDKGLITDDEFQSKKMEILRSI